MHSVFVVVDDAVENFEVGRGLMAVSQGAAGPTRGGIQDSHVTECHGVSCEKINQQTAGSKKRVGN